MISRKEAKNYKKPTKVDIDTDGFRLAIELNNHFDTIDAIYDDIEPFIEEVFEIAFGDNAINRYFTHQEVLDRLKEFSEKSWMYEELEL